VIRDSIRGPPGDGYWTAGSFGVAADHSGCLSHSSIPSSIALIMAA
jgi:hypothetical protein